MAEYDTTTFVNIDTEEFTGYFNASRDIKELRPNPQEAGVPLELQKRPVKVPNGYTFKPNESRQIVAFMAETFAKHLIDKILQRQGIRDTMRDTELRRSLYAKILPDIQKVRDDVKPLSPEEENKALRIELEDQKKRIDEIMGKMAEPEKNEEIEALKKELAELKAVLPKEGKIKKEK